MPPPLPPPDRRRRNSISDADGKIIGDFLVKIGEEISSANDSMRTNALKNAEDRNSMDFHKISHVHAEYKLGITVGVENENTGKKRESQVTMNADYEPVRSDYDVAPFNVMYGVISPAEKVRDILLTQFKEADIDIPADAPMFCVSPKKYWVVNPDGNTHFVVSLFPGSVDKINSLDQFNEHFGSIFAFLQKQIRKSYGDNYGIKQDS